MRDARKGTKAFGLIIVMAAATTAARGDAEEEIPFADCPAAVQKTMRDESKGAKIDFVYKETEDGETTYWASIAIGGKDYEIGIAEDGTLTDLKLGGDVDEIRFFDCPAAVQKTFREESKAVGIDDVGKETKFGITIYGAVVPFGGKTYEIKVAEDGTLTEKKLLLEEDEVDFSACPAAVQQTLREQARGGDFGEITRSLGVVRPVYMVDVEIDGKGYFLEVSEDGLLISKSLEDED
jgi:hypothetical protein